jgi:hypothetical protein
MPKRWKSKPGAKRRLADEYDGAQERREVRAPNERTASGREAVGVKDIGLTHKQIHEARAVRDAEIMILGWCVGLLIACNNVTVATNKSPRRGETPHFIRV